MKQPKIPELGPTGSPVESWKVTNDRDVVQIRMPPPRPPERGVWEFDDDDVSHWVRDRTDDEMRQAMADYETANAEWKRTGGLLLQPGPWVVTVNIECKDGSKASGAWDGERINWLEVHGCQSSN